MPGRGVSLAMRHPSDHSPWRVRPAGHHHSVPLPGKSKQNVPLISNKHPRDPDWEEKAGNLERRNGAYNQESIQIMRRRGKPPSTLFQILDGCICSGLEEVAGAVGVNPQLLLSRQGQNQNQRFRLAAATIFHVRICIDR